MSHLLCLSGEVICAAVKKKKSKKKKKKKKSNGICLQSKPTDHTVPFCEAQKLTGSLTGAGLYINGEQAAMLRVLSPPIHSTDRASTTDTSRSFIVTYPQLHKGSKDTALPNFSSLRHGPIQINVYEMPTFLGG